MMINATATFVFCDIVEFSRNDDDFQAKLICGLNAEVRHQLHQRLAEPEPSVMFLPTGDGLAIVLLERDKGVSSSKEDVFGLVERLMRYGAAAGKMRLRIGVHHGSVALMRDINGNLNVCGTALNDCQRIMDAAHPNQVLLSRDAYRRLVGDRYPQQSESMDRNPLKFSNPLPILVKHRLEFEVRIMFREGEPGWENREPYPDGLIIGKKRRTEFIVRRLSEMLHTNEKIEIYEQSALSTFGIASNPALWGHEEGDYVRLIQDQKAKLHALARQDRTSVKLVLRPIRRYTPKWMRARCEALLESLQSFVDAPNVDFVVVEDYEVPNRLIVKNGFSIEGYKMYDSSGYELSVIRTATDEINEAIESFEQVFQKQQGSNQSKADVIRYFEKVRDSCVEPEITKQQPAGSTQ
jgi:hypothetical protein